MHENEQAELITVIGDFLEMGHVENIMAMFNQQPAPQSAPTYASQPPGQKPKMRGPDVDLAGLTGKKTA